jgi:hypothetical protein
MMFVHLTFAVFFSRSQCRGVAFLWPHVRFKAEEKK